MGVSPTDVSSVRSTSPAAPDVIVSDLWILDSGASAHFTENPQAMATCEQEITGPTHISTASGHCVDIVAQGSCNIATTEGVLHITGVKYSPRLTRNLISLARLVDDGYQITLGDHHIHAARDGARQATFVRRDNLYVLRCPKPEQTLLHEEDECYSEHEANLKDSSKVSAQKPQACGRVLKSEDSEANLELSE